MEKNMKKFVFGCILIMGGIIGGTGWLIAYACLRPNSNPSLLQIITSPLINYDGNVILFFYIIALIGLFLCIIDIFVKKNNLKKK